MKKQKTKAKKLRTRNAASHISSAVDESKQQMSLDQNISTNTLRDITITFNDFTQTLPNVDISSCIYKGHLSTKKLVSLLSHYNISTYNKQMKYFLEIGGLWLACPKMNIFIEKEDYQQKQIKLQLLENREYIDVVMENSQESCSNASQSDAEEKTDKPAQNKCKRLKERKIKHVLEKVLKWRQLYAGIGQQNKMSLQQGAKHVRVSKKTLDDYLSQIKKGHKYGFNFNQHKNDKVGVLREFIRKFKRN